MPVIRPPSLLPTLVSTLGLFRHAHRGLDDPAQMPCIERSLPAGSLDPQWLLAYCRCIGLPAIPQDGLPPLTLQIAAAPLHMAILADKAFPFAAMGLVHMSQGVTQNRPVPADASLTLRAWSGDARRERRGMSFALITEASLDGEVVWRGETRALALDRAQPTEPSSARSPTDVTNAETDKSLCEVRLQVPEATGRRYARVAGDLNPIHQRAVLARLFGFRRAIVHGTWTLARALVLAELSQLPAYSLQASFRRPVELPSEVLIRSFVDGRLQVASADGRQKFIEAQISQSSPL
jgi:acyl dehydratase